MIKRLAGMLPVLLAALLFSTSCNSLTPKQAVFDAQTALAASVTAANAYAALPFCSETVKAPCSQPKTVVAINKALHAVDATVDNAVEVVNNHPELDAALAVAAAEASVKSLKASLAVYGVKF